MTILEKLEQNMRRRDEKRSQEMRLEIIGKAAELYQLKEYDGEIWLTYSGHLVCPSCMLSDDPVEALRKMRDLYLKRHEMQV